MNHLASSASAYVDADDNIIEQRNSISANDIIQVIYASIIVIIAFIIIIIVIIIIITIIVVIIIITSSSSSSSSLSSSYRWHLHPSQQQAPQQRWVRATRSIPGC